ncbi:16S rRNA m(4)C1402 methyltransferase [uncultured Gammaproteobacteria bacterium]
MSGDLSSNPALVLHVPVLLAQVLAGLEPREGGVYVDATFGAGGYSRAILDAAPKTRVLAIDRDPEAIARCHVLAQSFPGRLTALPGSFGDLDRLLADHGMATVDGVVFDLGMSSPQIDTPERGFSFRFEGPLDMRMGADGPTAADLVGSLGEVELAKLIFELGEERRARRVARAICAARIEAPITTTTRLAAIVRAAVPPSFDGIDPSTRTFQALRIAVNDELGQLEAALAAAERVLTPGGRLAVVAFHSLEDRMVKDFLRDRALVAPQPSRHLPMAASTGRVVRAPTFTLVTRRPVMAEFAEITINSRARSAKLRVAERTVVPVAIHSPLKREAV